MTAAVQRAAALPGSGSALWYLSRGTGLVCLVLLTVIVVLGVASSVGARPGGLPRFVIATLHRNAALLVLVFLALHVLTTLLDAYAPIRVTDVFLPFASAYRPLWLGLGALALDLLLAIVVTSLLRERLGMRTWRLVHWLTYLAWPVAVLHALGTGSDASQRWVLLLTGGCVLAVVGAVWWRTGRTASPSPVRAGARTATVLVPLALCGWLIVGPLAPGWAARSGTPPALLAASAPPLGRPTGAAMWSGTVEQVTLSSGLVQVTLAGLLSGGPAGQLSVVLVGRPLNGGGGGVTMTSSTATLSPASGGTWTGAVVSLDAGVLRAHLVGPFGGVELDASLTLDASGLRFTGAVALS